MPVLCEHSNEPLDFKKGGAFLDWLSDCYLLKRDSVLWSLFVTLPFNCRQNEATID
jgi:hypothetical protein